MLANGGNPISIIKSADDNFYLTANKYDHKAKSASLWLMKLTQNGDTVWTKQYPNFSPHKTILTADGDLLFYGSDYYEVENQHSASRCLKVICLDREGALKWQKAVKQNYYEEPVNVVETKNGNFLFSSVITPIRDQGDHIYIFELDKNGKLTFEEQLEYHVGLGNVPFLIRIEEQITVVGQKWIGKFGQPFDDIIQITQLTE